MLNSVHIAVADFFIKNNRLTGNYQQGTVADTLKLPVYKDLRSNSVQNFLTQKSLRGRVTVW